MRSSSSLATKRRDLEERVTAAGGSTPVADVRTPDTTVGASVVPAPVGAAVDGAAVGAAVGASVGAAVGASGGYGGTVGDMDGWS